MAIQASVDPARYKKYFQKIQEVSEKTQAKEYSTAIFSLLVVSLFSWYAIRPTIQTILTLQKEIEDNKIISQQMEEKIGKLIEVQSIYDSVSDRIPLLEEALPSDSEAIDVVRQLRNLANQSGASVSGISFSAVPVVSSEPQAPAEQAIQTNKPQSLKPVKEGKIVDIPVVVTLSGSFDSIRSFLASTVNMRRILTIISYNIIPDQEATNVVAGEIPLRIVLQINAHYLTK